MSTVASPVEARQIVQLLGDPAAYPDCPTAVQGIETHLSWVFLTDRFVYKLKKPVRFEFVDFTSLETRRIACVDEIRLNRRLAHGVYLALLPITWDPARGLQLDGDGKPVDYVVKMRRLPAHIGLDRVICRGEFCSGEIDRLVKYLVDYGMHATVAQIQPADHYAQLRAHCDANRRDLADYLDRDFAVTAQRIGAAQQRYLGLQEDLIRARVAQQRVIDGHGDLRAEHVFLEDPPSIIDCVEFSSQLRQVDVIDEFAFLAVDCARLGNSEFGSRLFDAYFAASGDDCPIHLIDFYRSYRACVRAKVATLRSSQVDESTRSRCGRDACQYLAWADHHASLLGLPAMLIIGGTMGCGKSTLAKRLARSLAAVPLHTDEVRHDLFGPSDTPAPYDAGHYRRELRQQVYDALLQRAGAEIDRGRSVVLDGGFLTNELRWSAVAAARRHGAVPLIVECSCPLEIARRRVAGRPHGEATGSEARPTLVAAQREEHETLDANLPAIKVNTVECVENLQRTVCDQLRNALGM